MAMDSEKLLFTTNYSKIPLSDNKTDDRTPDRLSLAFAIALIRLHLFHKERPCKTIKIVY